jgi:undecaprenyl-diphosphatase
LQLIAGFVRAKGGGGNPEARLMWRLIAGTIPAGLLGLLLEKQLRVLFSSATAVLDFLSINGLLLLWGERLGQRRAHKSLDELSIAGAIKIGSGQALALLPGISRSGITLLSGLAHGLDHASAARFSFLLATPIILAAGVLEIPKLAHAGHAQPWGLLLGCGAVAGQAPAPAPGFSCVIKKTEIESLRPLAGIASCLAWVDWLTAWTKL